MKRRLAVCAFGIVLILSGLAACKKAENKAPAGTTPIDQLIQAGKAPVEVGKLFRGMSPVAPTFTVVNVSDCPSSLLKGTVVFFDEAGTVLADSTKEMGYADLSPIAPGAKLEPQTMTQNDKAVRGKWILKEVIYKKATKFKEYGELPFKWTNKNFDAELAAATGAAPDPQAAKKK